MLDPNEVYNYRDVEYNVLQDCAVQFPDLTEAYNASDAGYPVETLRKYCKTQFLFATTAPYGAGTGNKLRNLGFKELGVMNNWYSGHTGQKRAIRFFWMKLYDEQPVGPIKLRREGWGVGNLYLTEAAWRNTLEYARGTFQGVPYYEGRDISCSGCGFKLADNDLTYCWKRFFKYFTLLRMPPEVGPRRKKILERMNFRQIDVGSLASYWLNGWKPEEYDYEKEKAFFAEWNAKFRCKVPDIKIVEPPKPKIQQVNFAAPKLPPNKYVQVRDARGRFAKNAGLVPPKVPPPLIEEVEVIEE